MKPVSIFAFRRILDTRRRIEAMTWRARSVVIVAQLRELRGTW
jgi:hypothetical protein